MTIREASAEWQGTLKDGAGRLRLGSGVFEGAYSFPSRFESGPGTNQEELIAAAHAGCFSMALTAILGRDGHVARSIRTAAKVHLGATAAGHYWVAGNGAPNVDTMARLAEGWQSGRMRRSRKPLSVVRRIEGSNPSPSASRA